MQQLKLALPVLMFVTDRRLAGGEDALIAKISASVAGGVNVVQVREKDLGEAALASLTRRVVEAADGRARVLVNDSSAAALFAGADGVHLPEEAQMPERPPRPFLTGRSVHSREAAQTAWEQCVDYLIAGPVYPTPSHPGRPPAGPSLISEISTSVGVPVLAIGGIDAANAEATISAGAAGVAVISAILTSPSPGDAAHALSESLAAAWQARAEVVRSA